MSRAMTQSETNTIDISSARTKRPAAPPSKRPPSFTELYQQLGQQLQTTLEADRLLGIFFERAATLLPLAALDYRHPDTDLQLQIGESAPHSVAYRLRHQGEDLGELRFEYRRPLDDFQLSQLEALLGALFYPLRNTLLYRRALLTATRDPLTAVGNRLAMNQMLTREVELARRHGHALSVIMLDLDHFKALNDRHGHPAGDEALRQVAALLKMRLRNADMLFRFGGEEFLVLLSNTGPEAAMVVGERLRSAVEGLPFQVEGQSVPLSISLGCATYLAPENLDELLGRADQALYLAKRSGRNRLSLAV